MRLSRSVLWLLATVATAQQQVESLRPSIIVGIRHMDPEAQASVLRALASLVLERPDSAATWPLRTIQPGDTLYNIISNTYHFSDKLHRPAADALLDVIQRVNGLTTDKLVAGQHLRLPPLPTRPRDIGATPEFVQRVIPGIASGTFHFRSLLEGARRTSSSPNIGAVYLIPEVSLRDVQKFLAVIPAPVRDRILGKSLYIGPTTEKADLYLSQTNSSPPVPPAAVESYDATSALSSVASEQSGHLYLFDLFNRPDKNGCAHGDVVFSVAATTLRNYGLDRFVANVKKVELNVYLPGWKEQVRQKAYAYAHAHPQDVETELRTEIDRLLAESPASPTGVGAAIRVPLLLIAALNHDALHDPETSVVSSSYYAFSDGVKWLPEDYRPDNPVVFVNAVLDTDSKIENSVNSKVEPISTYWNLRKTYGVILVGAEQTPGHWFGMYSDSGDGVTCLARGFGWNQTCPGGTSFAAPFVAVQLMLARSFWKAHQLTVDAREAKTRLLLSSEINPSYVGKYASGGIPQLNRLLRTKGPFGVRLDGSIVDLSISDTSQLTYRGDDGFLHSPFLRRTANPIDDIAGIQIVGSEVYLFRESELVWRRITDLRPQIVLVDAGQQLSFQTAADLANKFKAIIVL